MTKTCLLLAIFLCALKLTSVAQYTTYSNDSLIVVYDNAVGDSLSIAYKPLSGDTETTWVLAIIGSGISFDTGDETISLSDDSYLKSVFDEDTVATLAASTDLAIADLLGDGWSLTSGNEIDVNGIPFVSDLLSLTFKGATNETDSAGFSLSGHFAIEELDWELSLPVGTTYFESQYETELEAFTAQDNFSFTYGGFSVRNADVDITYETSGDIELNGTLDFVIDEDTISAELGDSGAGLTGLELSGGSVTSFLVHIDGSFSLVDFSFVTEEAYIQYDSDEDLYIFYADTIDVSLGDDSIALGLGSSDEPGGYLKDGAIDTLRFELFHGEVLGLSLKGETLTFDYNNTDAQFEVYGGPDTLGFVQNRQETDGSTTPIDHEMYLTFGTKASPGMIFKNGSLQSVDLTVTDTLTMESVGLFLDDITIDFDQDNSLFELYGTSIGFALDEDTLSLGFGDSDDPGLLFGADGLESLNLFLNDTISLFGLTLYSDDVTFQYDSDSSFFELYGDTVGIGFEGHDLVVAAGTDDDPGIIFEEGTLTHLNLGLSDTITLGGASLRLENTFFQYDADSEYYEIYGGPVDLLVEQDSLEASFGTSDDPGVAIIDGELDSINLTLTSGARILGLELVSDGVNLKWKRNDDEYAITDGSLELKFDQDNLEVDFSGEGDGLIIKDGELETFQGEISSTFSIVGLDFSTDSLLFSYDADSSAFEIHSGEALLKFDQDSLIVDFGADSLPGMLIENGVLTEVAFVASAHESLLGLSVSIDSMGVVYEGEEGLLSLYDKEITVVVDSDSVEASLGDATDPGLVFQDGELQAYTIGIISNFKLKSLEVQPENLVFAYDFEEEHFEMYDSMKVVIDGEEIDCHLGDEEEPGIIIVDGSLTQLNVDISSDITLGGMELIATDAGIRWPENVSDSETPLDQTELFGDFQVKELWSADLNLGDASQPGILITEENGTSSFEVENLDVKLGEVHVGFATIENMELKYDPDTLMVACTLIVSNNFEAEGDIELVRDSPNDSWKLNDVGLGFEILPPNEGLPVGPVFLQGAQAQVNNLSQEADLQIEGSFQLSSGEPYSFDGNEGFLMFLDATGTYDPGQFDLSLDLSIGAYFNADTNPNWNSTIGDATLTADFDWAANSYTLNGTVVVPTDYGVKATADIIVNDNVTAFYGDLEVRVPESWDFIGGDVLGNVGGAFYVDHNNSDDSYAAGWTTFEIGCVTCDHWWCDGYWRDCLLDGTYGLQYNFGSESFSEIGQSGVDNIQKQFNNQRTFGTENVEEKQTFEIMVSDNEAGDKMMVKLLFDREVDADSLSLSVIGPHKLMEPSLVLYDSIKGYFSVENLDSIPSGTTISELSFSLSETTHGSKASGNFKSNQAAIPKLPELEKGMYEIVISAPATVTMETVLSHSKTLIDLEVAFDETSNEAEIKTFSWIPQVNLKAVYDSATNTVFYKHKTTPHDSDNEENEATIKIFVDTDTVGYDGRQIAESHELDTTFTSGIQIHTTDWEVTGHQPDQPYYFYATISDKTNAPVLSKYTEGITVPSRITGQLVNTDGSNDGVSGVVVFLDLNENGKLDLNKIPRGADETAHTTHKLDGAEPSAVTDENGYFHFDSHRHSGKGLAPNDYAIEYYLKRGFKTTEDSAVKRGDTIEYSGTPVSVEINISEK